LEGSPRRRLGDGPSTRSRRCLRGAELDAPALNPGYYARSDAEGSSLVGRSAGTQLASAAALVRGAPVARSVICWENRMPLARSAVYRTGPQIWAAPTADDDESWRRMQGTSTNLVDRVLPHAPMRQWVLSLPRWARYLLPAASRSSRCSRLVSLRAKRRRRPGTRRRNAVAEV